MEGVESGARAWAADGLVRELATRSMVALSSPSQVVASEAVVWDPLGTLFSVLLGPLIRAPRTPTALSRPKASAAVVRARAAAAVVALAAAATQIVYARP